MITVDCSDVLAIKDKMLVYVADKLKALPILKSDKFLFDSIDDSVIDKSDVISSIEEFLDSLNLRKNYQIISKGDDIKIEPLDGTYVKDKTIIEKISKTDNTNPFFECTHCGFMTMYEEELRTHLLIHYI